MSFPIHKYPKNYFTIFEEKFIKKNAPNYRRHYKRDLPNHSIGMDCRYYRIDECLVLDEGEYSGVSNRDYQRADLRVLWL